MPPCGQVSLLTSNGVEAARQDPPFVGLAEDGQGGVAGGVVAPVAVAATAGASTAVVPSEEAPASGAKTKDASVAAQNNYERIEWCG